MTRPRLVEAIRQSGGGPVRVTAIRAASPRTVEATRRSDGPAPVVTIVREPARAVELLRQGVKGPIYMVARDVLAVGGIPTGQLLTNISDVTALADATWAEVEDARREFGDLRASIQAAANVGGSAQAEVTAARRGFADLLASVSAAALSATWSQVVNRPLTLADLDSAAATDLTNTRTELVAARGASATVGARLTAEETLRASADSALAGRATTLESAVFDAVTGLAATRARLTTEETARADGDSALAVRATNLETEVTNARQGQASVSARLSQIDVARSDGDTALAGRATTLEAQMADTAASGLRSRISTEEAVRASADSALAGRATTLEAQMADTAASGLRSRIATEEIARANADSALAVRATNLETEVTGARQGQASVSARLSQIDTARSTGDTALAERATNLETEVTNARQGQGSVSARLSQIDTARSDGDSALAVRATSLETEVQAARQGQASVSARLSQIDVARSDGDTALAGRATTLEARAQAAESSNALNRNPLFADYPTPNGPGYTPPGWWLWNAAGPGDNIARVAGVGTSPWAMQTVSAGSNFAVGVQTENLADRITAGWHVIEVDFTHIAGSIEDAGVLFQYFVPAVGWQVRYLTFRTIGYDPPLSTVWQRVRDIDGEIITGSVGRRRRFRYLLRVDTTGISGTIPEAYLYLMAKWGYFADPNTTATSIRWERALIRPATTQEVQAQQAALTDIPALTARITTEEAVRASADTALAGRATTLEAQIGNTAASGLQSRIATEEITRANADSALATRATTLEARATAVEGAASRSLTVNNNPQFLFWEPNGSAWFLTGGQKPVGWATLWGQGTYTRHVNADGRVVLRQTAPAGLNEWLETLTGPANEHPEVSPGRHILKATAALVSGTFSGAFAYAAWFDASYNFIAADWITLWSTPTIAGTAVGAGTAGVVHTWSKEIDLPANARRVRIAAMGHWSANDISAANSIDWYECSLTPMSAAEINSTVNIPLLDARITTEEAARIAGDSAEAVARTTLAAKLELTGNLFPDPNGSRGTAFLNAYPDSAPSKWTNPSAGDTWLKEWAAYPSGFDGWRVAYYDIPAGPGTYTGSAYVARTANIVPSMYMVALDGAGTALAYSGVTPAFPASPSSYNQRVVTASPLVAPAGTATIRLVIQVNGAGAIGQYANYSLRQIQIETGSVATVFNESGQNRAIAATVEQNSGAIATLNGATAWWQLLVNASGGLPAIFRLLSGQGGSEMLLAAARVVLANVDGTIVREALRLISGNVHIVNKLFVGASIELDPTAQAIILTAASARLVLGIGFGTSSDLVVWFGPVLALADMTQANATFALTTTGGGRFRDTLLIGSLTNSGQTTLLDNAAEIVVGPFGTLGNTKTVVLSYSAVWERSGTWGIASQTYAVSAVIKIDRRLGAGTWTEIGTLNASGSVELEQDLGPDPDTLVGSMSGSLTITDTTGGTSDFSYRGRITSRTDPGGFGNPDSQRVSVASIE